MTGLSMLQNRGYDSCGICTLDGVEFKLKKSASTDQKPSIETLAEYADYFNGTGIGIGHTRWATHGPRTDTNSHPHLDHTNRFAVVHNGIIENYESVRAELQKAGIPFQSQTDTEVIVALISFYYDIEQSVELAINRALNTLEGTWGLVIMSTLEPEKLYCARHGSPLLIGFSTENDYAMIASEQCGFSKFIRNYIVLNDTDIAVIERKHGKVHFDKKSGYQLRAINYREEHDTPYPHPHWTLKEIIEQHDSILRATGMGSRISDDSTVHLGGLSMHRDHLIELDHLILLGCGTSYNSGLMASNVFKKISGFDTVQVFDGAEFTTYDLPKSGKTGIIMLSQSGETKDLHRCIAMVEDHNVYLIGVVNVVDSLISREVNCGVYLNAGREVAVASTKSFSSQVVVLYMIAVWFAQHRDINVGQRRNIINDIRRLPHDVKSTIAGVWDDCRRVAQFLADKDHLYILGKGVMESIAKEASLKLKEIGYIHAEGYSSSALKHGTYSIIYDTTPVILLALDDEHFTRNNGISEELKSRYAPIIGISDRELGPRYDYKVRIPGNHTFRSLLVMIAVQLIAYELALLKGHNPDIPRNLAKVVTVD